MSKLSAGIQAIGADLFLNTADARMDVGARVETNDGRAFRYVKAGAVDLVAGNLLQAPAIIANHQNLGTASTQAIGDTQITFTTGATAVTANQYAGGLLTINAGTGKGYALRIKSHAANAGSVPLVLTLEDPIQVATDGTTKGSLSASPYMGVIQSPTTATSSPVGVATYIITAAQYGWIQVQGAVSVLSDATIAAVGLGIMPSTSTAGCVTVQTATGSNIGYALQAGVSAETRTAFINLG